VDPWDYLVIVAVLCSGGASYFFALAESALFALGKLQSQQLAEQRPEGGGRVWRLLEQPAELLATIVLGNTLANAMIVAFLVLEMGRHRWPDLLTGLLLYGVILLGCEALPKTLAVRNPTRWAVWVAPLILHLEGLTRPLQRLGEWVNTLLLQKLSARPLRTLPGQAEEEYRELLELACQQGTLAAGEKETILDIIALDKKTAQQVMTPRSRVLCLSDEAGLEQMLALARQYRHRRLPMYDDTPDTIVGVLDTKLLLLDPQIDLADAIEFPAFVPGTMNLLVLLQALQRQKRGMAVVVDEYGTFAGVVTMENILEEILGEIRSEGEDEGFVMEKLAEGRWRISGTMRVSDFQREYPALGLVPAVDTMGGLLTAQLEVVPAPGESAVFRGLRLTAQNADERRVRQLLVEVLKKPGEPG